MSEFNLTYKSTVLDGGHVLVFYMIIFATKSQRLKEGKKGRREEEKNTS